jgi:hypothetical protein
MFTIIIRDLLDGKMNVANSLSNTINLTKMKKLDCSSIISDEVYCIAKNELIINSQYFIFTNHHFINFHSKDPLTKKPSLKIFDRLNQNSEILSHILNEEEKLDNDPFTNLITFLVTEGQIFKIASYGTFKQKGGVLEDLNDKVLEDLKSKMIISEEDDVNVEKPSLEKADKREVSKSSDYVSQLRELKKLLDEDIITTEEYEKMKKEVLNNR